MSIKKMLQRKIINYIDITTKLAIILFSIIFHLAPKTLSANVFEETFLLKKYPQILKKEGFIIHIKNGENIVLHDRIINKYEPHLIADTLVDVFDNRYAIFFDSFYVDALLYNIIDLESGNQITTSSYPNFSFDKLKFVSVRSDENSYSAIDLYEFNQVEKTYNKIFTYGSKDNEIYFLPYFVKWIDNNKVLIKDTRYVKTHDNKEKMDTLDMELVYEKKLKKWQYRQSTENFKYNKNQFYEHARPFDFEKRFPEIRDFFKDKEYVISIIKNNKNILVKNIHHSLYDDKDVMCLAIRSNILNKKYLSTKLKKVKNLCKLYK